MDKLDLKKLENLLKCKVCEEIFSKPTILGCGHTFCSTCLTDRELCPQCSKKSRWRNKIKSKISFSVKWHTGNDIVNSFKDDEKDKEKIIKALKVNMKCAVCCAFFIKAVVTVCGHVFCHSCLQAWTNANHPDCPVCRTVFESTSAHSISWPLGDQLAVETRMALKRTRTEDSGKTRTTTKKVKTRSSTAQKEQEHVKNT